MLYQLNLVTPTRVVRLETDDKEGAVVTGQALSDRYPACTVRVLSADIELYRWEHGRVYVADKLV